ncbi:MAG: methyltransferase, partial [Candidatus Aminicenantes bacterium]|nr:methyltransferase [Candidatus Aminicenantes bacterium]
MTSPTTPREGETLDAFYHGRVRILQKKNGYRFSVDAPLLADFIRTRPEDEALELGTGSGVISLLLSVKAFRRITALELQAGLADLARRNVELNGLGGRIEIVEADLRTYEPGRTFDLIFSNPPYIR